MTTEVAVGLVLGGVIGFVASLFATLWVEFLRRPILTFQIGETADGSRGTDSWRFLHVEVLNNIKAPSWLRWILLPGLPPRYAASAAQAWVSYSQKGSEILRVEGRWSSTPEPLTPTTQGALFDSSKVLGGQRENIPYGGKSAVAIGLKFDGEKDCFAFNSWSYAFPKWKNPDWRLPDDRYEVRVVVTTSGYQFLSPVYVLDNPSPRRSDFCGVPVS